MEKNDDGGSVYPMPMKLHGDHSYEYEYVSGGMSLWDYYAGLAMGAIMGDSKLFASASRMSKAAGVMMEDGVATASGNIADAMIAEKRRREAESEDPT